jgi:hypothetical protein
MWNVVYTVFVVLFKRRATAPVVPDSKTVLLSD